MFRHSAHRRWMSLFIIAAFVLQLAAPSLLVAGERERFDKKLLTKLAGRVHVLLQKIVEKVSSAPGNDVELKMYFCDDRHRVFAQVAGSVTIRFPKLLDSIRKKFEAAVGSCLSTNGSVAFDFAVKSFEKTGDKQYRIEFDADVVITLKEVIRETLCQAASIIGAVTIGKMLSKFVNFFDSIDADVLGQAIKDATTTLWALGAGKIGIDAYDHLDKTGHLDIKKVVVETLTLRSLAYHFGVFILKAGVAAGATLTKMGIGAAIGSSLAGGIGVFLGAALAVAAVSILGNIIVTKLMVDMPMWWRFRKIAKLYARQQTAHGQELEEIAAEIDKTEDYAIELVDDEIRLDRYNVFDKLVGKLHSVYTEGDLTPYEGLIEKLKAKLTIPMVHDSNWNAARKYYQLLKAIGRLPQGTPEEAASEHLGQTAPAAAH